MRIRMIMAALAAATASIIIPASQVSAAQASPDALPAFFILQNKAANSLTLDEWVNDVHGHNAYVEMTDYHHTPYHFVSCITSRGIRWCGLKDERRNCLQAARAMPGAPSGIISATCAGISTQRFRFVKDGTWLALLNQHFGQYVTPMDQSSGCELNGGCPPVIMFPHPRPWKVSKA